MNSTPPGNVRMYPRVFVVRGTGESYVYVMNATVRLEGYRYLTYEMRRISTAMYKNCHSLIVGGRVENLSGDVYLVVQEVVLALR